MSCKGCARRYVGCHADCEDYKAFKQEIEERKKREREYHLPHYYKHEMAKHEAERKRRKLHYD